MGGWHGSHKYVPNGGGGQTDDLLSTRSVTHRIPYTTAGNEVSFAIPDGTKKIRVATENLDCRIRVSYDANGTTSENSYETTHVGNSYFYELLKTSGLTLYYNLNKSNVTVEITLWS